MDPMKRRLSLFLMIMILSASTIPTHVQSASTTQRFGIIVGISDYESIMDLELTDDDAVAMDAVLRDLYWTQVTLLLNQQASRGQSTGTTSFSSTSRATAPTAMT